MFSHSNARQNRWAGPLITLGAIAVLEISDRWNAHAHLASVLVFSVTLSAYLGGVASGLISTTLVFAYALVGWNIVGVWHDASTPDHLRVIFLAIVTPTVAVLVGVLREAADRAIHDLQEDIARRAQVEAALAAANGQLSSVMKFSPDLICKFDMVGHFVLVSDSSLPMTGYTVKELIGRNYLEFVHPDDRARTVAASTDLRVSSKLSEFENRILHKDGRIINLLWATAWDAATQTTHSIGRDVTHLREAEAALAREKKTVATLQGLLSVCAWCNNIRNENDGWEKLEHYVQRHADVQVSHGMCPKCLEKHYPEH